MPNAAANRSIRWIVLVLLAICGLVSLAAGVRHCLNGGSTDLQWGGAHLLGEHIDPWQEALGGYVHHPFRLSPPNYLHLLYVLLLPFGTLGFDAAARIWCVASILFSVATVVLLGRFFKLNHFITGIVLCIFWMSSPFRVVLQVGQLSLFELFFFCAAYASTSLVVAGLCFGVTFAKYSFTPPAALLFLFRGRIRLLALAAILPVAGLLVAWSMLSTPLRQLATEPFKVSQFSIKAVNPGVADEMTFSEESLKHWISSAEAQHVAYLGGLLLTALYSLLLSRFRLSRQAELTLISLASLFFLKHLIYDYVFLLAPLCFAFATRNRRARWALGAGVAIFWFISPIFGRGSQSFIVNYPRLLINFLLLGILLAYSTYVVLKNEGLENVEATEQAPSKKAVPHLTAH